MQLKYYCHLIDTNSDVCVGRGPEGRNRLRHASGSRALPAINDSFDAFEQLGLERAEPGQVHHCTALLYFYQNRHKMHI